LALVVSVFLTNIPISQAVNSDKDNFVVLFHKGFVDWFWKTEASSAVANYQVTISGGESDSTFFTSENFFVPADHGLANPTKDKTICVTAKLLDGQVFGTCGNYSIGKLAGQVINFDGGPSPIYKVNSSFQDSISPPHDVFGSEPTGINGKSFSATDSVFLSTNIYYLEPPYTSKVYKCAPACVEKTKVVSDFWNNNKSPNYTTATVLTPETCQVMRTKVKENGENATEIRPLRDNVDCKVSAKSYVPFLTKADVTANFTIHFQRQPYSLLAQLPNGEVNPTVGTETSLQLQQLPLWEWLKDKKYTLVIPAGDVLTLAKGYRSLTPKICSIKQSLDEPDLLNVRGLVVGKCQIELEVPQQNYSGDAYEKYAISTTISDYSRRIFTFNVTKPKVNSKDVFTRYACMVSDSTTNLYTVFNLTTKSVAPKKCQTK
jgi:hypothetical protein